MRYNYNHSTLMGRLTKDPETVDLGDKKIKTSFTLAIDRDYVKEDGSRDTDFIPVCFWGKPAELTQKLLAKGSPVLVWGRINVRNYTNKENQEKWITEVIGDSFQVLQKKSSEETTDKK